MTVSTRTMSLIAATVLGVILACAVLSGMLLSGVAGVSAGCRLPTSPTAPGPPGGAPAPAVHLSPAAGIGGWDHDQVANAAAIVSAGIGLRVPARGQMIALAVAMQESLLRNLSGGDRDSIGLFQQRPSQGWGTPAQLHDPTYAATAFYIRLLAVHGWARLAVTDAAQAVQRSAYPDAYAKWQPAATALTAALTGTVPAGVGCAGGWVAPVDAPVGSAFRTPGRPDHNGVDLLASRGTPVHAAAAGTVVTVACQAVDLSSGGSWGCDRDGDPARVAGCGWYVDIAHPGGILTRYCHLLSRPTVADGQPVAAGQVLGLVGSSGQSTGAHLHFEVHLDGRDPASAVDPTAFMAAHGAPLG